ncbi:MAG: sigma-54-dependent Fis family transcriptional regulator [Myxococcales bacterium]|nr:sigma-54-dependent Fis family transcriptional regulator [Myxococcales bacterium]
MLKVLIVDDQPAVCTALQVLFEIHGYACVVADGPGAALACVRRGDVGVVVQDMNFTEDTTSGDEGVRLFRALRAVDPDLPILLMTAWTALETAVQMVKEGASDYVQKPWDDVKLVESVGSLMRLRERSLAAAGSPSALARSHDLCGLVYASPQTEAVVALAVKVAAAEVPVLILGPNGAGKEKVAEIVQANSRRAKRPFVRVNAGALPETLIESELFGSEAGAFTGAKKREGRFEAADGGTIFLDEIGNLSLAGQMKLLRVLQTGEFERVGSSVTRKVDVRVISATNADLPAMIAAGTFREDLYFRLNVIELRVPPLCERSEDVLPLARHFLDHFAPAGEAPPTLADDARRALEAHAWPGNVRELRNCIQRAALLASGGRITAADLHLRVERSATTHAPVTRAAIVSEDPEARAVRAALARADGVVATAAAELGISRQALYRRMDRFGIVVERRATSR